MSDLEPRFRRELDKLYDGIEATAAPPSLEPFKAPVASRRRWSLTTLGSLATAAVALAALAGVAAIGLTNHRPPAAVGKPAAHSSPTPADPVSPSASPAPSPSGSPDPTLGWRVVSDPAGQFSFRVPAGWQVNGPCVDRGQSPGDTPSDQVRVGPADLMGLPGVDGSTGKTFPAGLSTCGADFANGITVNSYAGAGHAYAPSGGCTSQPPQPVTIAGVSGTRQIIDPDCPGYSSVVQYRFVIAASHRDYVVAFQRNAGDPDLTAALDVMMSRTWAFHG